MSKLSRKQVQLPVKQGQHNLIRNAKGKSPASSKGSGSKNEGRKHNHRQPWADLEWKSKYRFWDSSEMGMYSQIKLKHWMENRQAKNIGVYPSAQELISRYLRPLKYRQKNSDETSSVGTKSKSSDRKSTVTVKPNWWICLPTLSNEELCNYCWKCQLEQVIPEEAENNFRYVMSGRVEKSLGAVLKHWKKDPSMFANLSVFGKDFYILETKSKESV